jgi:hypothetical protein
MRRVVCPVTPATNATRTTDSAHSTRAAHSAHTANSAYSAYSTRAAPDSAYAANSTHATDSARAANSANTTDSTDTAYATYTTDSTNTPDTAHAADTANSTDAAAVTHEIIAVVDIDAVAAPATTPAPAATPKRSHHDSDAKRDRDAGSIVTPRRIVNRRIGINGRPVDDDRIVRRYVHHLRIGLFDHDDAFVFYDLGFHRLLLSGLQSALVLRLLAHSLNGIHDVGLLRKEGITQIGRPLNVVTQPFDNIGQSRESLNTRIPGLFSHCVGQRFVFQRAVFRQPLLKLYDFKRICGCSQRLGQQRVRIEGNGRYQRIQLVRWNFDRGGCRC